MERAVEMERERDGEKFLAEKRSQALRVHVHFGLEHGVDAARLAADLVRDLD